jgi:hypothetical protein
MLNVLAVSKVDRVVNALTSAKAETTVHTRSTVGQLQAYLLGNSNIKVFSLNGARGEVVRSL